MSPALSTQSVRMHDPQAGVRNLLVNCAQVRAGDRLLIAYEPATLGYFDSDILDDVSAGAASLGLDITLRDVGFAPTHSELPAEILGELDQFDAVLFLSRLGDQLRFSDLPKGAKFVVCFALNSTLLGSAFGTADYRAFVAAKTAVDRVMIAARQITVTCPKGTHVQGRAPDGHVVATDTSSVRFPMSVFSPVPAAGFSGRVAMPGFLTGTGSRYYEDYTIEFDGPLFAIFQAGQLTGFDGAAADVAKANAQYDRVAARFGLARNVVHSWHAGIHPGCGFPWDIRAQYERWGGAAFGNPRILHFHTSGAEAPGEISWNVIDPTVVVDGLTLWENGQFHLDRLPEGPDILAQYPCAAQAFAAPDRNIGLGDAG